MDVAVKTSATNTIILASNSTFITSCPLLIPDSTINWNGGRIQFRHVLDGNIMLANATVRSGANQTPHFGVELPAVGGLHREMSRVRVQESDCADSSEANPGQYPRGKPHRVVLGCSRIFTKEGAGRPGRTLPSVLRAAESRSKRH